ncbi:MAG: antitoxin [Armatimonadetes bacterium]|nr:antitoxin [Armatimonadota bacterium]
MSTKLTLRIDEKLVESAKRRARASGTPVSQLVADYFSSFDSEASSDDDLHPRVRALMGIAAGAEVDEEDYHRYLEEKYR